MKRIQCLVLLGALGFSFLAGCSNKRRPAAKPSDNAVSADDPSDRSSDNPHVAISTGPLVLRAEAIGKAEPYSYSVQLTWESNSSDASHAFLVKRSDWNEARIVQGNQQLYLDQHAEAGKTYL